jgi:hypothetical protein
MSFITWINSLLTFIGQVVQTDTDVFGDTTVTSISTTACFVYMGEVERDIKSTQLTRTFDFTLLLPSNLDGVVSVGNTIQNVVDINSRTVINTGVVEEVQELSHWSDGLQVFVCGVNRK